MRHIQTNLVTIISRANGHSDVGVRVGAGDLEVFFPLPGNAHESAHMRRNCYRRKRGRVPVARIGPV